MKLALCGDLLFSSRGLAKRIDPKIVEALKSADAGFANAEFSTPKPEITPPGLCMYLTSVPQNRLDEFNDLNLKLVSFANNHTTDYGWEGAVQTIEAAEARDIIPCGVGRNLEQARKPRFLDTPNGRVGIVAADATWSERALASMGGADTIARPGLCPLRWSLKYILPDAEFEALRHIDQVLGTADSMKEVSLVECWPLMDENHIKFGSAMQGNMMFERGEKAKVETAPHPDDEEALLKSIRDARLRSDVVVATIHTHEGENENWYATYAPEFIEKFAHDAIDNGADVFLGQGAHMTRGVEMYKGKPIFYNVGSLVMEFEAGESMISPEMYATYGHPMFARPSDLHCGRAKNKDGEWQGFYSGRRFAKNFFVMMDTDGEKATYKIVPIDIDMRNDNHLKRGIPMWATPEVAKEFAEDLTRNSERYGTKFRYNEQDNTIEIL